MGSLILDVGTLLWIGLHWRFARLLVSSEYHALLQDLRRLTPTNFLELLVLCSLDDAQHIAQLKLIALILRAWPFRKWVDQVALRDGPRRCPLLVLLP